MACAMNTTAQAIWCQWPLADRLRLVARWQSQQSHEVQTGLSLLSTHAATAVHQVSSTLPSGQRHLACHSPIGRVEVVLLAPEGNTTTLLVHIAWACVLGNALHIRSDCKGLLSSIESLRELLITADPLLEPLVQLYPTQDQVLFTSPQLITKPLHLVVSPSAELPTLIQDIQHFSQRSGLAISINHSLHHEVTLRLPQARASDNLQDTGRLVQAGELVILKCGNVLEQLESLQADKKNRTALYSNDWIEIESACDTATQRGSIFAVNTPNLSPLCLIEAQALYQQPSTIVLSHIRA